jgi:hypothetical protein
LKGKRRVLVVFALLALVATSVPLAGQFFRRGYREPGMGFADADVKAEFFFTRLAYSGYGGGRRGQSWTTDWPEADYHFMQGLRRLTGIDAAEGGRFVQPGDDEIYEYPWIYAVEVGNWVLSDEEAAKMREYLLRGGFLMVDDFHGGYEWNDFLESMRKVFPDRPIVDIPESDALMTIMFDIDQRVQIPGVRYVNSGITWEREDGYPAHWRGIYDDDERLIVAINHNMDLGDAWEHADYPYYPEQFTALAYRFGVNYVVYAMTH